MKINTVIVFVITVLNHYCSITAQSEIMYETKVSNNDKMAYIEPVLEVNPLNSNEILIASFTVDIDDYRSPRNTASIFLSTDSGKSWKERKLPCKNCADPWITTSSNGITYLTFLADNPNSSSNNRSNIVVYTSKDFGRNWSKTPQYIKKTFDGPRTFAANDGSVYLAASTDIVASVLDKQTLRSVIYLAKASPGEETFSLVRNYVPSNLLSSFDDLTVLQDGTLCISYWDYMKKVDGGFKKRDSRLKQRRSWVIISKDGGKTFSEPFFISEDGAFRPNTFISSNSGPYENRLYYASVDKQLENIIYNYSDKLGDGWTSKEIEAPASSKRSRWFPQLTSNKKGVLAISWLDFRDSSNGKGYAPYISFSKDGGNSFIKPIKVASQVSYTKFKSDNAPSKRWTVGCDYFGFSNDRNGLFHVAWPDARSGNFEIYYAKIKSDE